MRKIQAGRGCLLVLGLSLLLSACGDPTATPQPSPTATLAPSPTTQPTAPPIPTVTVSVATVTPLPTMLTPTTAAAVTAAATTALPTTATVSVTTARPALTTTKAPPATTPVLPKLDNRANGIIVYEFEGDIWTLSLPEGLKGQLTKDGAANRSALQWGGLNRSPVWSPDSLLLAFASARDLYKQANYKGGFDIYTMRPDGSNVKRVTQSGFNQAVVQLPVAWLATGEILVQQQSVGNDPTAGQVPPLVLLDPNTGQTKPLPVKDPNFSYGQIAVSPNKTQLAYTVSKPGDKPGYNKVDIFVTPLNGNGAPKALTNFEANLYVTISALTWSPDSQNIAFMQALGDGCGAYTLYSVGVNGGTPRALFNENGRGVPTTLSYAPSGGWLVYNTSGGCIPGDGTKLRIIDANQGGQPFDLLEGSNPSYGRKIQA